MSSKAPHFCQTLKYTSKGVIGFSTFKQVVLWWLGKPIKADLTRRRDPHALELSANREPMIQGEPNESSNLAGAEAVAYFGQHLIIYQIVEIELLDEGADYKNLGQSPWVHLSPFSWVAKEGWIPQGGGGSLANAILPDPKGDYRWSRSQRSKIE